LIVALIAVVVIASAAFYAVESGVNPSVSGANDAIWWGITTLAGGSSDIRAVTDEGRIATVALLVLGVALLAGLTATVVSFVVSSDDGGPAAALEALIRLRRSGVISDAEFADLAARLSRLP
jgi:Ion channel